MTSPGPRTSPLLWCIFLGIAALLSVVIYHPVGHFDFLNFDDNRYLAENPWLKEGLTGSSIRWAFTANLTEHSLRAEYWSPLTLLSRLADAQIYGVRPGPFHITNALFHFSNAVVLCAALFSLTGCWWRSVFVALLFLVHPLNVEPVSWLSARKDLVSAFFFFATLWAYARYVRNDTRSRYFMLLGVYLACLMSKPMGVTVPFVLLVLDFWPLRRWEKAGANRREQIHLMAEKVPLLLLAVGGAVLAVFSQQDTGAVQSTAALSLPLRIENALVSYATYVRRVFWPSDLAIYYPHPGPALPFWQAAVAFGFLVAVTGVVLLFRRRYPWLLAGWIWFGVVLGPVIGIMQIGGQAMADRYAYPSVIGIFIALVWGIGAWLEGRPRVFAMVASLAIATLAACSMRQVTFWENSITAASRAIAVTQNNGLCYLNLGTAYLDKGDLDRARESYLRSLEIMPQVPFTWQNLGVLEQKLGHEDAALENYRKALELNPKYGKCLLAISQILLARNRKEEAIPYLRRTIDADPTRPDAYIMLGNTFDEMKRWHEGEIIWTAYLERFPENAAVRNTLNRDHAAQSAGS